MRSTAVLFALLAAFLVAAVVSADNRDFGTNLINECLMVSIGEMKHTHMYIYSSNLLCIDSSSSSHVDE